MKTIRVLLGFVIIITIISYVIVFICYENKGTNARLSLYSKYNLQVWKPIFLEIDMDMLSIRLDENIRNEFLVKDVISGFLSEDKYSDAWGNPVRCMTDGDILFIWSDGPNKIDDSRKGDDLVLEVPFYNKLNPVSD